MKKIKTTSIVMALFILLSMLSLFSVSASNEMAIGDTITLGTYYGEAIVWRCVSIDENGPLMLSDKILCLKAFDANGTDSTYHKDGWGYIRNKYGSNCWYDSSIRQWLNTSGTVKYTHCPPTKERVYGGYNAYASEAGFLTGFSDSELSMIKEVTQKVYINEYETHRSGYCNGGSKELNYSVSSPGKDYSSYWHQNVTDRFFFLGPEQVDRIYYTDKDYLLKAYPTQQAVDNSDYKNENLTADLPWVYWLGMAGNTGASYEHQYRISNIGGAKEYSYNGSYSGTIGVRPAFYLNESLFSSNGVSVKYTDGENPKVPTFFITPKALDGGWGKNSKVSNVTAITNNGSEDFSEKFQAERSEIISTSGSANGTVTIKADGYRNYIIPNEVLQNASANSDYNNYYALTAFMQLRKNDKPYISSVFAKHTTGKEYKDITANKFECNKKNTQDIIVSVDGLADGETVSKVYILQSSKESFKSSNGVFKNVQLSSKLEQEKAVYVYAVTNKGRQTDLQEVKIDIGANDQFGDGLNNMLTMDLLGNNGQSIGLDTDIPFLKDAKVSLDALKIPIGISRDGDKWRISLGVDIFTYENEIGDGKDGKWKSFKEQVDDQFTWLGDPDDDDAKSFKDAINKFNDVKKTFGDKKKVEEYIKSKKKTDLDFNFGVLGYIEGEFDGAKWTTTAWEGGILVNFKIEKSTPISILGFPCYWGIGGGADGSAKFEGARQVASKDVPVEMTFLLSIEPFITGKFGAGIDKLLYAGITGKGSLPVQFKTADKYLKIDLSAEFGWEAGIWILTADGIIWKGSTTIVEKYFNDNTSRAVRNFAVDYVAKTPQNNTEVEVQVMPRDYAETTSEWLYGEPNISTFALRDYVQQVVTFTDLQKSIFADSKLQMVQVGKNTFATWIEDDTSRNTYNRMKLVYSVRDGDTGLWSEPKAVWDTGVNDGYPSVVTDGEKVYIAWQKVNKVITQADCSNATAFYNNGEICLAEYDIDTDKILSSEIITDNNYYDYSPIVMVNNVSPVVFWTSSEDNDMTAMDGCKFNRYSDGTTTTLLEGISSPITVSADIIDGKEYISYCTDTDGDFSTTEDITVNTYVDGMVTSFDKGDNSLAIKDAKYGKLDGDSVLFMQDGTNIFYEENGETVYVFDVDRNIDGNFSIVEAINGTQLIWTEKEGNGSSNIYSCVYSDGEWSDPVKTSKNDKYITNLKAVCADGKIIGGCNRTEVYYNEETGEVTSGLTDLSYWSMADFSDISIELFSYNEKSFIESGSNSFDLHITNNGTINIDEIGFLIEDTFGNSTTVIKEVNLLSGNSRTVEIPYTPSENYAATTLTVTAIIPDDVDEEDNIATFDIGSSDVSVEVGDVVEREDCFDVSVLVTNVSLVDAKNVKLSIFANSEDGDAIETFDIGNMTASSISDAHISIKKESVTFSESGTGVIYLKLTADDESNANNNDVCIPLILGKDKECGHPITETVEGKEADCIESGYSEYEICVVCQEKIGYETIPTGHHTYGNWTVDSEDDKKMSRTCTVCGDVEESAVYLAGRSLLFKDIIQMRYYFDFSKFGDDVTETGLLIWTEDEYAEADEHNISTAPYKTTDLAQNSKGYYYGDSAGIPAKNMIDKQIAIAYAVLSDGAIEYTEECVFSPVMYSQIILAEGSTSKATMKTLAASLMNYGAAAQNFFNYKTEIPMNAWMSDELKAVGFDTSLIQALPEIDNNKLEGCNDDTVSKRGSSLTFVGNINQNVYFDIKDDVITDAKVLYWTEAEYKKLDKLTTANAHTADLVYETTNSCYRAVFEGVAAKDLRDTFVFAVYYKDAEGNEHYSTLFADGAHDYVRRVVTGTSKQTMKDLAKAFLMYHLAAEDHLL